MNSGIRALDKSQFVSFAQKLSKNKFQSHSLIKNNPSSKIQTKNNSNLIYANIIPSKERSKSLNAMITNVFKQPKQKEEIKKNESNDFENLISNLDNDSNIKIYESKKKMKILFVLIYQIRIIQMKLQVIKKVLFLILLLIIL